MNKELEALNYLYNDLRLMKHLDIVEEAKVKSAYECLYQTLQRLEAIDNAKPSEALECLKKIRELFDEIALENQTTYKNETFVEAFIFKTNAIVVEQALINFNNITKQINDATSKSAIGLLNKLKDELDTYTYNGILEALLKTQSLETINYELMKKSQEQEKVLKIIIEKGVDMGYLKTCKTLEEYNSNCWNDEEDFNKKITQEEFDLLKEINNG